MKEYDYDGEVITQLIVGLERLLREGKITAKPTHTPGIGQSFTMKAGDSEVYIGSALSNTYRMRITNKKGDVVWEHFYSVYSQNFDSVEKLFTTARSIGLNSNKAIEELLSDLEKL